MKYLILLLSMNAFGDSLHNLAMVHGFKPSHKAIHAIRNAASRYRINQEELMAIAILESGANENRRIRINKNGTMDVGMFQINTVNFKECIEYDLLSIDGSAFCAAKLLAKHKSKYKDYVGRYHSKTPSKKRAYQNKVNKMVKTSQFKDSFMITCK